MPPWRIADRGTEEVAIVDGLDNVHALAPPDGRERRCAIGRSLGDVLAAAARAGAA